MLTIKNIDKIKGRAVGNSTWEVDCVLNRSDTEYLFRLTNKGLYKHYAWAIVLDRQVWGDGYRLYCLSDNKEYDTYIRPNEIGSMDRILSEMEILIEKTNG